MLLRMADSLLKYIRLSLYMFKIGLMSAFEYRFSFFAQSIGMILNDCFWVFTWKLYYDRFPNVAGWHFNDTMILFGLCCFSFGIFLGLFAGAYELSRTIYRGELDYYLTFPKNPIWHVSVSRMYYSGVGDILFGMAAFWIFGDRTILGFLTFLTVGVLSGVGVVAFVIITQSISFFVGNFEEAAESFAWTLASFGIYPGSVFDGALKILICTLVPAFFVLILPAEIVRSFSWENLAIVVAATTVLVVLAILVFQAGLKRYESGSLVQSKV